MKLETDPRVKPVFDAYPEKVKNKLRHLRKLVIDTASQIEGLDKLEETLKWGEPSYLAKYGSTIRMDWKSKTPDQYAIYFKCTSQLVPTFKTIYKNVFRFEGNRAIVFQMEDEIREEELKNCISMALRYQKLKHIPLLGA